jgi:hypothetical protein
MHMSKANEIRIKALTDDFFYNRMTARVDSAIGGLGHS